MLNQGDVNQKSYYYWILLANDVSYHSKLIIQYTPIRGKDPKPQRQNKTNLVFYLLNHYIFLSFNKAVNNYCSKGIKPLIVSMR